jgi:tryptophan 5-monooxygenase
LLISKNLLVYAVQCFFFTVEFGLCKQNNELKVYGAGLLSSAAELQHAVSDESHVLPFDPEVTCRATPMITTYQEVYFYTDTFEEAKEQMREFATTIKRPFGVRYNPYTQSVEILSNTRKILDLVSELKGDLCIVKNSLRKIKAKTPQVGQEKTSTCPETIQEMEAEADAAEQVATSS